MENIRTFRNPNTRNLLLMLIGAVLGGAVGYGAIGIALKLRVSPDSFTWFDCIALWLGIVFISSGIAAFFVSTSRKRLACTLEGEEAELPATNEEVFTFRLQAVVLALAGVMMLIPTFVAGSVGSRPGSNSAIPLMAFAAVVVLFATQTAANFRIWRTSDEFARGLLLQVAALTFALGQGALFLYAAAERLHLAPAISSWDVITLLLSLYLAVNAGISLRHRR
jgi:hypothetical protein